MLYMIARREYESKLKPQILDIFINYYKYTFYYIYQLYKSVTPWGI